MQISSFTEEKLEDLQRLSEKLKVELQSVIDTSAETMWKTDLDKFEKKYRDWLKEMELADAKRQSNTKKRQNPTTNKKKK